MDVSVFGKRAEALEKHFSKGDPITVAGQLKLDRWEKDGQKRSKHHIEARDWWFTQHRRDQAASTDNSTESAGQDSWDATPF